MEPRKHGMRQLDWDARTYDRVSAPQWEWAERVLARLPLRGDERVMDAGCGSGRVTRLLLERLPRGRVYAVDRSPAMLAVAREQLADAGERVRLVEGDLTTVALPEPVEAIFSNATFHWILDHAALFGNLHRLLAPGGMLSAQCGGAGNVTRVRACADLAMTRAPFADRAAAPIERWRYAGPAETAELLSQVGFEQIETWLEPAPAPFPDRASYVTFLHKVVLGPYLERLPSELRAAFAEATADEAERSGLGHEIDYVRLNLSARRPS